MRPTFNRSIALVAVAILGLSGCASQKDPTADGTTTATGLGKFGPSSAPGAGFGVDGSTSVDGSDLAGGTLPDGRIGSDVIGPAGGQGGAGTFADQGAYGSTGLIDGGVISAAPGGGAVYTDATGTYGNQNAIFDGANNGTLFDNSGSAGGNNGGFSTYGSDTGGDSLSGYTFPGDNGQPSYFAQQVGNRVLFETDSVILSENARETLRRQAAWLQLHPEHSAVLEGHADERGTREYNLGLGAGRANAARQYLSSLGVSASRLRTVSYGKERPVSVGSGPASWSKNRRVDTALSNGANF